MPPIVSFSLRFVIIRRQSFTHFAMAVMLPDAFLLMFITQKRNKDGNPNF
jgi:hypothetical protein